MSSGIPTAVAALKMQLEDVVMNVRKIQRAIRHQEDTIDRSEVYKQLALMEQTIEEWRDKLTGGGR